MNWLMRWRGDWIVAGTNARFRRLLNCSPVPARQFKAETLEEVVGRYEESVPNGQVEERLWPK
jgi:hypothetical protein